MSIAPIDQFIQQVEKEFQIGKAQDVIDNCCKTSLGVNALFIVSGFSSNYCFQETLFQRVVSLLGVGTFGYDFLDKIRLCSNIIYEEAKYRKEHLHLEKGCVREEWQKELKIMVNRSWTLPLLLKVGSYCRENLIGYADSISRF